MIKEREVTKYEIRRNGKILRYLENDDEEGGVRFITPFREGKAMNKPTQFGCSTDYIEIWVDDVLMGKLVHYLTKGGKLISKSFAPINWMDKHIIIEDKEA